jgi:hypothetical protein
MSASARADVRRRRRAPRIFLSYRREDAAGYAGRLYDALAARFGSESVFMDVDAIEVGSDFGEEIDRALADCDVAVAVIGRGWLSATAADGRRRLDDPDDVLRLELERALAHDLVVIPALVQGAQLPAAEELPPPLAPLVRRQAIALRDDAWRDDVARLLGRLESVGRRAEGQAAAPAGRRRARLRRGPTAAVLAVAAVLGAALAAALAFDGGEDGNPGGRPGGENGDARGRLLAALPPALRAGCNEVDWGPEAARVSVSCSGGSVSATYHLFASVDVLRSWYQLSREETGVEPDSGECTPSAFAREQPHVVGGETVGRSFCFMDGQEPNILWTDERAVVAAEAATWNGTGAEGAERLLRQWRCCFQLEP